MKYFYNNKSLKHRRNNLRWNTTNAEKILWEMVRCRKMLGYKFRRQYSAGPYIIDFYCPELRLAIELDGIQHSNKENVQYDQEREKILQSLNIKTLRFWNYEILEDPEKIIEKLTLALPLK